MVENGQGAFVGIFMQTAYLKSCLKEMDFMSCFHGDSKNHIFVNTYVRTSSIKHEKNSITILLCNFEIKY